MTEEIVMKLGQDAIRVTAMVSAPLLLGTLVIGLLVSIFQALTQINEATLTFIPKMIVVGIIFVLLGPWMLDLMTSYTVELFENIAVMVRDTN
ncbi:MAG: flagellar biosynthesis protein FliQ [Pseudobdellovibrionaceae bacterium]